MTKKNFKSLFGAKPLKARRAVKAGSALGEAFRANATEDAAEEEAEEEYQEDEAWNKGIIIIEYWDIY